MNIRFLTLAQQEVDEAFTWFNERDEGKGVDFLDDLDRAVRLVKTYPFASAESNQRLEDEYFLDSHTH